MDAITQIDRLAPLLDEVIRGITRDQLDHRTPCEDFPVRSVLEHMIAGATAFTAAYRGTTPTEPDMSAPLASVRTALDDLFAALKEPGALDQTVEAPFGPVPGETFARFIVLDGLVHGWDMASATGQAYNPPAELVAAVEEFARTAIEPLRGVAFGAAVEPPAGAKPIECLAAFTGRRPLAAAG